jgi:hypothetical protein
VDRDAYCVPTCWAAWQAGRKVGMLGVGPMTEHGRGRRAPAPAVPSAIPSASSSARDCAAYDC